MAIQPAPDDFERDVDALLRDPDVQQELESLQRERAEGRAVYIVVTVLDARRRTKPW